MGNSAKAFRGIKVNALRFNLYQVTVALIKEADVHDGLWQLQVAFGQSAANLSVNEKMTPTALTQILGLQLGRVDTMDVLTVDAAQVNPGSRIIVPISVN